MILFGYRQTGGLLEPENEQRGPVWRAGLKSVMAVILKA